MRAVKRKKSGHEKEEKRVLKEVAYFLGDILYNAVIIIALVVLIRSFLISPFRVIGSSMADTLQNNEFILIDKLSYHLGDPHRGDPIVFLPPITNKYPHKFEEVLTTNGSGIGFLDISELRADKKVFYCLNLWIQKRWFCQDKVRVRDMVYYHSIQDTKSGRDLDLNWGDAEKKVASSQEVKDGQLVIKGTPNQTYVARIYNSTGPEYFVKRVVGIPGDIIHIENGRVYLKTTDSNEFVELDESYLNEENLYHTYFKKMPEKSELKVPEGHYFVLGDNRNHSNDSRHWFSPVDESYTPYVSQEKISGKVLVVLWPPNGLRFLSSAMLE